MAPEGIALSAQHVDTNGEDCNLSSTTQAEDREISRDVSPDVSLKDDSNMPQVPIQSLYALTKLRALRSPG